MGDEEGGDPASPKRVESTPKKLKLLSKVPLLKDLSEETLEEILEVAEEVKAKAGKAVITQGEMGSALYLIVAGSLSVSINGKEVTKLKTGDYFGETALLKEEPRNATVTALEKATLLRITHSKFKRLGLDEQLKLEVKGADGEVEAKTDGKKAKFLLSKVPLFKALSPDLVQKVLEISKEVKYGAGENMIKQGEDGADLFVIIKGECAVTIDGKDVARLKVGDYFGETALMRDEPRTATVTAAEKVLVLILSSIRFKKLKLDKWLNLVDKSN